MSLTLRDAQFLSWKTFKKIEKKNGKDSDISMLSADLVKKAGEIAERIKMTSCSNGSGKEELSKLLSELLFVAFVLAENYGVILEEKFMQTMDDYVFGLVG